MDDERWVPTGTRSRIRRDTNRVPPFIGDHLWTWIAVFRASPCGEQPMLDGESLLRVAGVNCYYCKGKFHPDARRRPCPGPRRVVVQR